MTGRSRVSRGFTLVELSLVMAFLSILLMAILFASIHIGKIYSKGITNRDINQIGRDLTDSLQRDFAATRPDMVKIVSPGNGTGRLCLGGISYVWNTAETLHADPVPNHAINRGAGNLAVFERIVDSGDSSCELNSEGRPVMSNVSSLSTYTPLLDSKDRFFAVYDFDVSPIAEGDSRGVYRLQITVGTNEKDTTEQSEEGFVRCKPAADASSNFDYCAVADFDVIVRTGGN